MLPGFISLSFIIFQIKDWRELLIKIIRGTEDPINRRNA
jgi:hypothetical protein